MRFGSKVKIAAACAGLAMVSLSATGCSSAHAESDMLVARVEAAASRAEEAANKAAAAARSASEAATRAERAADKADAMFHKGLRK
jgi:hypothetical protein